MTTAADYVTYTDGDDALPTLLLEDEDGNRLTPDTIAFYYQVGSAGLSVPMTPYLIETGLYGVTIDTTGLGGNWLWGYWKSSIPAKSGDNWQAYVNVAYA